MKVIVGLGNPGEKYQNTRHNAGFMVVDYLRTKLEARNPKRKFEAEMLEAGDVMLVKPQTYMNGSGEAVQKIMAFYKVALQDLYVIHDDLDIKLGDYKIKFGVGPKVHNGINSVRDRLGNDQFWYGRLGVDNRTEKITGEQYVLQGFKEDERPIINQVIEKVSDELVSRYLQLS